MKKDLGYFKCCVQMCVALASWKQTGYQENCRGHMLADDNFPDFMPHREQCLLYEPSHDPNANISTVQCLSIENVFRLRIFVSKVKLWCLQNPTEFDYCERLFRIH